MELSQTSLAVFFAISVICGAFLGALYDITAILPAICGRVFDPKIYEKLSSVTLPWPGKSLKRRKTAVNEFLRRSALFVHDLSFMATAGVVTAFMIYRFNDGKWRSGALIGLIIGLSLYRITLRRPILALTEILRFAIKCIFAYAIHAALMPVRFIGKKLKALLVRTKTRILKIYLKRYSAREKKRLLFEAEHGFLDVKINVNGEKYARHKKEKPNSDLDNSPAVAGIRDHRGPEYHEAEPNTRRGLEARSAKRGTAISR